MTILNIKYISKERSEGRKMRVFFFEHGETIIDDLQNRFTRPSDAYRTLLPKIFEWAGLPAETKASWSQRAGCSCGCSPGFVLPVAGGSDLYVDVKGGLGPQIDQEVLEEMLPCPSCGKRYEYRMERTEDGGYRAYGKCDCHEFEF